MSNNKVVCDSKTQEKSDALTADDIERGGILIPLHVKRAFTEEWTSLKKLDAGARAKLLEGHEGNKGLVTGPDRIEMPDGSWRGVIVIDEDNKPVRPGKDGKMLPAKNGRATIEELERRLGKLPATLTARTASGEGRHYFFDAEGIPDVNKNVFNNILGRNSDVELLNDGEQAVFAGSVITAHDAAKDPGTIAGPYEWLDRSVTIATLPEAWVQQLRLHGETKRAAAREHAPASQQIVDEYVDRAIAQGQARHLKKNMFAVICPNHANHSSGVDFDGSTVVYRGTPGFNCMHSHCKHLGGVRAAWESFVDGLPCDYSVAWDYKEWLEQPSVVVPGKTRREARALSRAMARGLHPGVTPTRRIHNPGHLYTFVPGESITNNHILARDAEIAPITDIVHMLSTAPEWIGVLQWDDFRQRLVAVDPPMRLDAETKDLSSEDILAIRMWLECHGMKLQKSEARDVITTAAKRIHFNPVKEYLESLPRYDVVTTERPLRRMAREAFKIDEQEQPLASTFLVKTLVAAVRRIFTPGVKVDTMLVLCGPQGYFKSTSIDVLFGPWFLDSMPDLESRDASMALRGHWAVEFQEIDKWHSKEKGKVKEFLSRRIEQFRGMHVEDQREEPRQCVIFGTTNKDDFMSDETGERRQWPVRITQPIDLEWLRAHKDAIWADAVTLALGPSFEHWLSPEEEVLANEQREEYQDQGNSHDDVLLHLRQVKGSWEGSGEPYVTNATDIFRAIHNAHGAPVEKKYTIEINKTLLRLGCRRSSLRIGNSKTKTKIWYIPEKLEPLKARIDVPRQVPGTHPDPRAALSEVNSAAPEGPKSRYASFGT